MLGASKVLIHNSPELCCNAIIFPSYPSHCACFLPSMHFMPIRNGKITDTCRYNNNIIVSLFLNYDSGVSVHTCKNMYKHTTSKNGCSDGEEGSTKVNSDQPILYCTQPYIYWSRPISIPHQQTPQWWLAECLWMWFKVYYMSRTCYMCTNLDHSYYLRSKSSSFIIEVIAVVATVYVDIAFPFEVRLLDN